MTPPPHVDVVMRTRDDMPLIVESTCALRMQSLAHTLTVFDNDSTDGTTAIAGAAADQLIMVPRRRYVPGRVLNAAMDATRSEIVVFLNADCTPVGPDVLRHLVAPFADPSVVAVFGRQVPRSGCHRLFARDIRATFGSGTRQQRWRHCFSMAASAIRRSAWDEQPFDAHLQYSEDIDWTWHMRQRGYRVAYAPNAIVRHSHNYTRSQWRRRQEGEGKADATIFDWTPWRRSLLRYTVLPCLRQLAADWRTCLLAGDYRAAWETPWLRLAQAASRRQGFVAGLRTLRSAS